MIEVALCLLLGFLVLPTLLAVTIAVKIDGPGPVLYRSRRVGRHGREFEMLKFRKMRPEVSGAPITSAGDDRFTRVGRFLAATKLDEFPQLWNVIRGDMSLVGPRPEDPCFVSLHERDYETILQVRPGITGLSQLAFVRESALLTSADDVAFYVERLLPLKLELDRLYVARRSLMLDARILVWTLLAVAGRDVAVNRKTARLTVRRRAKPALGGGSTRGCADRSEGRSRVKTVILAGGRGSRLSPYTTVLPKPLMPIGDRTVLELEIEFLHRQGFDDITLCVGYLSHLIRAVINTGSIPGVKIDFVEERKALGTAGPLRLVPDLGDTFLVMNGDVLTSLDLRDLVLCHRRSNNVLTVAVQNKKAGIDFGILTLDDASPRNGRMLTVVGYEEKPEYELNVSMGIYVMESRILEWIPEGYFDFPDLVIALLNAGEHVGAYVHDGYWLDIGRPEDYEQAVNDFPPSRERSPHIPVDAGSWAIH